MKNILLLLLSFIFSCQNYSKDDSTEIQGEIETVNNVHEKSKNKHSLESDDIENKDISFLNEFNGNWIYSLNNEIQDYRLSINIDSVSFLVKGNHCFIRGEMGDFIDCSDNSIKGKYKDGVIAGEIKSEMTNESFPYTLKIESGNLVFQLKSDPKASFFQKEMIFKRDSEEL